MKQNARERALFVAQQRLNYEIKRTSSLVGTDVAQYGSATTTTPYIHTLDIKARNVNSVGSYQYTSAS
jgi:hypothetical protein